MRQLPTDLWLHTLNSKAPAVFKHGISIWPNADHTTDNPIKKVFRVGRGGVTRSVDGRAFLHGGRPD